MKTTSRVLVALAVMTVSAGPFAWAGNCVPYRRVSYPTYYPPAPVVYHEPVREVVVKEVVKEVPVLTPVFAFVDPRISYIHTGGNYVPVPQAVPGQPQAVSGQAPAAAAGQLSISQQDLERLADLVVKRIEARGGTISYSKDAPPPVPGDRTTNTSLSPGELPIEQRAAQILYDRCSRCHTGDAAKGQMKLFDSATQLADFDPDKVWDAVRGDRMPPDPHPKVPAEEKRVLGQAFGR
jgi:hypothetical protein